MRMRTIKPGIMSNEDLAELGPYAYILFTGCWMIADREGRFEYRPRRIKALVMPLWDEVDVPALERLVENLCQKRFFHKYTTNGCTCIQVVKWHDHQNPHPRESASTIPPPPDLSHAESGCYDTAQPWACIGNAKDMTSRVSHESWVMGNTVLTDGERAHARGSLAPPPTPIPLKTETEPDPEPPPKPTHPARKQPRPEQPRKPAAQEKRRAHHGTDFWPHAPEDVSIVRASLNELGKIVHLPTPDDQIIRRVLDACRGAPGADIHETLRWLYHRHKFRDMRSWGLLPVVLEPLFRAA